MPRIFKNKWDMGEIFTNLEGSDQVIIPTDKINSFRSASTNKYMTMVNEHLGISANEIYRDKVIDIFEKVRELVDEVGLKLSKIEVGQIKKFLTTKSITTPELLIKDHKNPNKFFECPTRLVTPAENYTATFAEVGYFGMKALLNNNLVNNSR